MTKVLGDAVRKLAELQHQVANLLTFFEKTFNEVEKLGNREVKHVINSVEDEEGRADKMLREVRVVFKSMTKDTDRIC